MSVIEWLESPEGEKWSYWRHNTPRIGAQLVTVKGDEYDETEFVTFIWSTV